MDVEELPFPPLPSIMPPSSLPLHHTTNDHFPADIRGYRHVPGPAPDIPCFPLGLTVTQVIP